MFVASQAQDKQSTNKRSTLALNKFDENDYDGE